MEFDRRRRHRRDDLGGEHLVLARLLSDTGKMATTHGRVMIGITLVEDLAVICMTVILPVSRRSGERPLHQRLPGPSAKH